MVALWSLAVRRYMVQTITICNATITHVHPRPPLSKRTRFRSHFLREHATGTMGFIEPHQWPHGARRDRSRLDYIRLFNRKILFYFFKNKYIYFLLKHAFFKFLLYSYRKLIMLNIYTL